MDILSINRIIILFISLNRMDFKELHLLNLIKGNPCTNFYLQELNYGNHFDGAYRNDFYMLLVITEGTIDYTVDFNRYCMVSKTVSLIFPHQLNEMRFSEDAKVLAVMFDETVFCSEILHNDLKDYNINLQQKLNFLSFANEDNKFQDLVNIWHSIKELYEDFSPVNKMQIKLFIKIMIMKLISMNPENSLLSTDNGDTLLYIKYREKVDKEYKENRVVSSYADSIGVSVKKLTEVCRHFSGQSPLEIIHEKLSLELKKVLFIDRMTMKEISLEFGFSSQAALNKYIENKFAMTPMQLKEKLKNSQSFRAVETDL